MSNVVETIDTKNVVETIDGYYFIFGAYKDIDYSKNSIKNWIRLRFTIFETKYNKVVTGPDLTVVRKTPVDVDIQNLTRGYLENRHFYINIFI